MIAPPILAMSALFERAPAATAPTPSSIAMIAAVCALASSWRIFDKCPPTMWPVSCENTPIN